MYARVNDLFCFHAAYLSIHGKGLMIGGPRGSGKTTTALTLWRDGFLLFSDEMTLCARGENREVVGTGWLLPPRFVFAAPSSLDALEETLPTETGCTRRIRRRTEPVSESPLCPSQGFKQAMALPDSARDLTRNLWIRPVAVVFLEQSQAVGKRHELTELTAQEAFVNIMSLILDPSGASRRERQIDVVLDLVTHCRAYRLVLGKEIRSLPTLFRDLLAE